MRSPYLYTVLVGVLSGSLLVGSVAWAQEPPPPDPNQPPPGYQPPPPGYQQPPPGYQQPPPGYQQQPPPPGYQQPPPGYQQPPPGYQQQPPPGYQQQPPPYQPPPSPGYSPYGPPGYSPYARPVYLRPPPAPTSGVGEIVVGSIFLPLGISLIVGSVFVWNYACNNDGVLGCFSSVGGVYAAYGGVFMDIFGAAFTIMGLIFIPHGAAKQARYNRWRRSQGLTLFESDKLRLQSVASGGPQSATLGLRLDF